MEPSTSAPDRAVLEQVRHKRAELRKSMSVLEHALAAPAVEDTGGWVRQVQVALVELAGDFRQHVEVTEGPEGLYHEILGLAPRLAGAVGHLTAEHGEVDERLEELRAALATARTKADLDRVRDLGTSLVGTLMHHRQRGSDLVFEAYDSDIGGET